jgi:hypothetical protein
MVELIALLSLAMSLMAFSLMASDLRWASRARLRRIGGLGELAAHRRQVCRGRAQITLQLRHPRFKCRLLARGGLGGIPGGGLGCGRNGLGSLGGLLSRRCICSELVGAGSSPDTD